MVNWTKAKLEGLGAKCELRDVGSQTLPDGRVIPLPNVIFGELGNVSTPLSAICLNEIMCPDKSRVLGCWPSDKFLFNHPISDYTQSGH